MRLTRDCANVCVNDVQLADDILTRALMQPDRVLQDASVRAAVVQVLSLFGPEGCGLPIRPANIGCAMQALFREQRPQPFPLLDLSLATVGLDSGALITRANNTAARPPVFGVIVSVWVVFVSVATADESTWLLLAIACVRIVWGCVHKWREVKG